MWTFFWLTVVALGLGILRTMKEEGDADSVEVFAFIYALLLFIGLLIYYFNTGEDFLDN